MGSAVKIWGHRGCRGDRNPPENSLAAFQAAIDQGADGIELDVFLTADNQLVVFHDDTLDRMTDGTGDITAHTLQQLKALRLKEADGTLGQHRIPTLDEVLDMVADYRRQHPDDPRAQQFTVNIEIKGSGIASRVADVVEERLAQGFETDNFSVSSFDMNSLREMRQRNPDIPIGALLASKDAPWDISIDQLRRDLDDIRDIKPDTVNITLPSLTPDAIRAIGSHGARPVAWTWQEQDPGGYPVPQQKALAAKLLNHGITMITDYPDSLRQLRDMHSPDRGQQRLLG